MGENFKCGKGVVLELLYRKTLLLSLPIRDTEFDSIFFPKTKRFGGAFLQRARWSLPGCGFPVLLLSCLDCVKREHRRSEKHTCKLLMINTLLPPTSRV